MSDSNVDTYQPTTRRQRLKIVAVTVGTVVVLWSLLLFRPGAHPRKFPESAAEAASAPKPCVPGQTQACVGGQANVVLLPARVPNATTAASAGH